MGLGHATETSQQFIFCFFSGVGGQVDFLRGAALGHDGLGKPILALNSVTSRGESKITPFLKEGTNITHMHGN